MRITAAIEHHPSRAELLRPLRKALAPLPVQVAVDPDPDRPAEARSANWPTYRRALETIPANSTHRLVVQDDAVPCRDFAAVLERAVAARPDDVLLLCVLGFPSEAALDILRAAEARQPFVELWRLRWVPAVAVVWPRPILERILDWVDAARWGAARPGGLADDEVLYRATLALGIVPVATVPSLVEHPDTSSISHPGRAKAGGNPGRVAALFAGDDVDGLTFLPPPARRSRRAALSGSP